MRLIINAAAVLAMAVPIGMRAGPQAGGDDAPACRAVLEGDQLTTTIEFPDGYRVEAPWRVLDNRPGAMEDGQPGMVVSAKLDRIVEKAPGAPEQVSTPFGDPLETTFEGRDEEELVYRAAQIWCLTVMKVHEDSPMPAPAPKKPPLATRIT